MCLTIVPSAFARFGANHGVTRSRTSVALMPRDDASLAAADDELQYEDDLQAFHGIGCMKFGQRALM